MFFDEQIKQDFNDRMMVITSNQAIDFLINKHYSGRKPTISLAFGWFYQGKLSAVCTFGKPASFSLCDNICSKEHSKHVYELNRLCRIDGFKEPLSKFVGFCLRYISKNKHWVVVSYSDTGMNHNGYIYQATNFIYTGKNKEAKQNCGGGNKHQRHCDNSSGLKQITTAKHRYVYFATNNKKLKKEWKRKLKYPIEPYPKEENKNYELGDFYKPELVIVDEEKVNQKKKDETCFNQFFNKK